MLLATVIAAALTSGALSGSRQALVVTTPEWNATTGTLQRYERDSPAAAWRATGEAIPVVIGRNGLAPVGEKREGDGRSPAGIYPIGPAFGFAPASDFQLPYRQLREATECVDDMASRFYNQIVDRDRARSVDWSSSEKMHTINQYQWGAVAGYNTPPRPGRGSCIFLHIWGGPSSTTSGCTAMREEDLLLLLRWLDPKKKPVLVQFPRGMGPRAFTRN